MYLSRVEIDKNNRRKIKDLSHVGAYHNWVEQSYPYEIDNQVRTRKLWRVDTLNGKDYLLVLSQKEPELNLLEKYGVKGTALCKNYDAFLGSIYDGMEAQFRVTLNPTVSIKDESDSKRGRVVPHITNKHQELFLMNRSVKNGFELKSDEFMIIDRGYALLKKSNQRDIRLVKATYQGKLKVIDKNQFRETLINGFGRKKAYGFGLMTIIPRG
ncbi:type I-E CRISPR-associated protein Cas6/Cse3/CasE [Falseniella ignava]|uniref:Type I-E CRISPR-associated protein Cas6/Cse3/CasE n=1 Tax=Falseniella ignava TaxID=137730 RepID=A0A2I1JYU5_9LACT|nr:type I-E CRISPR-associated protein Cas6/Cse3/CasE [Falseniella ignava]PKY88568.1 type I-E CRISPR-associated protein Cas6/Cse3/CasE [Falseniella ignava]